MKRSIIIATALLGLVACKNSEKMDQKSEEFIWQIDRFDDTKVLRYQVPGFEELSLEQKKLIYYLGEAALSGRDIFFDQNFKYNLDIRKTLEAVYTSYSADKESDNFKAFEKYLKKVWFANGIHHHYSNDKFQPEFSRSFLEEAISSTASLNGKEEVCKNVVEIIFNKDLYPTRQNQTDGCDMVSESANNYYSGLTQKEAEEFYSNMAAKGDKERPISYGLNSRLEKKDGKISEVVWKIDGEYSAPLGKVVYWLKKAERVAQSPQKETIQALISYYKSGDLKEFDRYNILWVGDTISNVDFVNGFIEVYGDPLGYKASWEANVNFKNNEATKRTEKISEWAQWFEDNSPIDDKYKKSEVKGVSAKVITVAMLGGDAFPATPIGINLPNADWIRKEHGSKSVTIQNITEAYAAAAASNSGYGTEFYPNDEVRSISKEYGSLADNLHTDLHECLGHGSGQLAPTTKGDELKNYGSPLEEARADLFALYYMGDEKLVEIGVVPNMDVMKAAYYSSIFGGLMGQLTRIEKGKDIVQAHMRCRQLIAAWCYDKGKTDNIIELKEQNGKHFVIINDYQKLRTLFGDLLREIQRIKSDGDYKAGAELIEKYGVKVDPKLHDEILTRYATLNMAPYSGFVNPKMTPQLDGDGNITDIIISYPDNYTEQMLGYSSNYSFL